MLPKFPKFPTIPTIPTKILWILPAPLIGLILMAGHPGLRLAGLLGLGGLAVPVHARLAGKRTAKILDLAESKWAADLVAARAAGVAEGRSTERELARVAAQTHAQETIARAQDELMAGYQRMEQELSAAVTARDDAIALKDRSLKIAQQYKAKHDAIARSLETERQSLKRWESELQATADRLQTQIEQSQLDSQRQELTHAQIVAALERKIAASQDRIDSLESALSAAQQAIAQSEQQSNQSIAQALTQQQQSHALEVSKLKTQLAEFTAGREAIARRRAAEAKLVTLSEVLDRFGPKPVFVAGPEGAGKGTTIVSYVRALAKKFGAVVPIVFDPSEDRLWELTGVPVTSNRALFFELIELTLKRAKSTRVDRTQADKFAQQAPIVFVVDESASLYAGLSQNEINHYQTLLDQLRTRGSKYALIPVFTAISEQIQNLKSNGKQILNGGTIAPMLRIWLNGVLDEYCCRFSGQVGDDLRDWLAVSEGEYRAAMVTIDGGAKVLIPMRHPSHHAQLLGEKEPTIPVTGPTICPPPAYWPLAAKILFGASVPTGDTLEPARELVAASYQKPAALSPLATAIFNFAVEANEPITANKFKRFGSKFHKGASRLNASEIDRAIDELVAAEMVLIENRANGGRTIAVQSVA
jgi:hypothetical protein